MRLVASVPIRARLTLAFVGVMAFVLVATGVFVYERTRSDIDSELDGGLGVDLTAAVAVVRDDGDDLGDPAHDPLARLSPDGFVQVIGPRETVAGSTDPALASDPVVGAEDLLRLTRGEVETIDVGTPGGEGGSSRLLAERTQDDGVRYYVIAGTSLDDRDGSLSSLRRLLLIGGPLALLLSSLLAYRLIGSALRPVDAMRGRAAEISESDPGQRLPVPPADDEIGRLGQTLNEMLGRLESAIERERRFAADASHELRTPLSILRAEVDLALASARRPEEMRAAIESVAEEVERLSQLAEDLLMVARTEQGRLPIRPETFGASELAMAVVSRLPEGTTRPRVVVPEGLQVTGDRLRLEQVLRNLLDNADAYAGGADLIEISVGEDGAELHVLDRGPGFPADVRPNAFERFAQADGDRAGGGAGLGLSIVDLIAHAHGGRAGIDDRPGGGADVWIAWRSTPVETGARSA